VCCIIRIVGEWGISPRGVESSAGKLSEEVAKILETIEVQSRFILYGEYHKGSVLHSAIFLCTNSKVLTLICNDKHKIDILRMLVLKPL